MDYPGPKRRRTNLHHDAGNARPEPELRLAEFSAPCGEEYPWRAFAAELPNLDERPARKRPGQRLH